MDDAKLWRRELVFAPWAHFFWCYTWLVQDIGFPPRLHSVGFLAHGERRIKARLKQMLWTSLLFQVIVLPRTDLLLKVKNKGPLFAETYKRKTGPGVFNGLIRTLRNLPIAFRVKKIPHGLTTWCSIPSLYPSSFVPPSLPYFLSSPRPFLSPWWSYILFSPLSALKGTLNTGNERLLYLSLFPACAFVGLCLYFSVFCPWKWRVGVH